MPTASADATLKSTSPTLAYFHTAIIPTGRSIAASEVPTALEGANFKNITSIGTMTMPPPMPNTPARMPAREPIKRPTRSESARDNSNPNLLKTNRIGRDFDPAIGVAYFILFTGWRTTVFNFSGTTFRGSLRYISWCLPLKISPCAGINSLCIFWSIGPSAL